LIPILWVTHVYPRWDDDPLGGFLHRLARELPCFGYSIHVLAPQAPESPPQEVKDGVTILRFPHVARGIAYTGQMHRGAARNPVGFLFFLDAYRRAVRYALRSIEPAIVHAHWWIPSGWMAMRAVGKSARPFVLSVHGTDVRLLAKFPPVLPLARSVFQRADRILPVSSFLSTRMDELGIVGGPRTVLPMPADSERFRPDPSAARRSDFVLAARLTRQKRVDLVIRGVAHARRSGIDVRLHIVGDGSERAHLENLSREVQCRESIVFHGMQSPERLADLFRSALAVVLCSEEEGYGLVLVEAALCETPGIGTRSGAIPEIIENEKTGWLAEADERGIGDAMVNAMQDPVKAAQFGKRARERALGATAQPLAEKLAKIYDELCSRSEMLTSAAP
jgi:glycosyltransferase involved in cell wall biosynthesis